MTQPTGTGTNDIRANGAHLVPGKGRPFRFLAIILILWTGGRIAIKYAETNQPGQPKQMADNHKAAPHRQSRSTLAENHIVVAPTAIPVQAYRQKPKKMLAASIHSMIYQPHATGYPALGDVPHALLKPPSHGTTPAPPDGTRNIQQANHPAPLPHNDSSRATSQNRRWSASMWMLWREKGSAGTIQQYGQLGGAQAGLRVERAIGHIASGLPVRVYGRLSRALQEPGGAETAAGLTLIAKTGTIPISLHGERRIRLEQGGRNAFALFITSGINPTTIIGEWTLEGYAQAGIAGLQQRDTFADGRVSLTAPTGTKDHMPRIGVSLSGGTQSGPSYPNSDQPDISRLDIGPVLEWRLPLAGQQPRLLMEWRQRIAGRASPGSGPAITLATDF